MCGSDKDFLNSRNLWKWALLFFVMTWYRGYQSRGEPDKQSDNLPNTFIVKPGLKTEIESERKTENMRHLRQSVSTLRRLNLCGLGQKQTNDILDQLWERFDTLNIFISSLLIGWGKCLKPSHRMRSANSTCWGLNWKFAFLPMFLWPGCCHKCVHNCHLSWTHSEFTQNDKTQSRSSS